MWSGCNWQYDISNTIGPRYNWILLCRKTAITNNKISSIDGPRVDPSTQAALSYLSTLTSSALLETPPFLHLLKSYDKVDSRLSLPVPLMAVISGGQKGVGKLRVRSFLVSPSLAVDISEGAKYIINLYKEVGNQLSLKQGVSFSLLKCQLSLFFSPWNNTTETYPYMQYVCIRKKSYNIVFISTEYRFSCIVHVYICVPTKQRAIGLLIQSDHYFVN